MVTELEQQVLELQKHLPKGVKQWRASYSGFFGRATIDLIVALPGAYDRHSELVGLLNESGVPILESSDKPDGTRLALFVNPEATYIGRSEDLGNYDITVSGSDARGVVKLHARRNENFGQMHRLVEVVKKYTLLFEEPQAKPDGNDEVEGENGQDVYKAT